MKPNVAKVAMVVVGVALGWTAYAGAQAADPSGVKADYARANSLRDRVEIGRAHV